MSYSGITVTTDNGVVRVTDAQQDLTDCEITDETVVFSNNAARVRGNVVITRSRVQFTDEMPTFSDVGYNENNYALTYGAGLSTAYSVKIIDSVLAAPDLNDATGVLVNELINSKVQAATNLFVYTGPNAILNDVEFYNIKVHEVKAAPAVYFNVRYRGSSGIRNEGAGRLDLLAVKIETDSEPLVLGYAAENNEFWCWDIDAGGIIFENAHFILTAGGNYGNIFEGKTVSFKFMDRDTEEPLPGVLLIYRDDQADIGGNKSEVARFTTDEDGLLNGDVDTRLRAVDVDAVRPTVFVLTGQYIGSGTRENIAAVLEVRSYLHQKNIAFDGNAAFDNKTSGALAFDYSVASYRDFRLVSDSGVILSRAAAEAIAGVSITDHGAFPVGWNGKSWGITIVGDKAANPALTADALWHHVKAGTTRYAAFNGRDGIGWHMWLVDKAGAAISTQRGVYGDIFKGVRVVDENGNPFPGVLQMQSDDGSFYIPDVQYTLTISGFVTGSDVVILEAGTSTILQAVDSVVGTDYSYSYTSAIDVDIGIIKPGYKPFYIRNYSLQTANSTLPVALTLDRDYQ